MSEAVLTRPKVEKPAHIPDALVYEFDFHHDEGIARDPHKRVLEIIDETPPIFWTPYLGGMWVLRGHEAVHKASRDWETFTSQAMPEHQLKALMAARPDIPLPIPINVDPPMHSVYRQPLQAVFSPRAAMALRDKVRALAGDLIDAVKGKGECEFMREVAEPLPVKVFLDMLGLPSENYPEYRAMAVEHLQNTTASPEESMRLLTKVSAKMRPTIEARRTDRRDDIFSLLWNTEIEGRPTTQQDIENYGVLLFIAGLDTVMNGMGHGVRHLAMNPDLQRQLRENPKLIVEASEEMLRRYTFTVPPRTVKEDCSFLGVEMKAGERALLFLPAADLDAVEFPRPEEYELDRENNVHIAFGVGPHRCLGSHLARVELQILYEEILARLPEFRLDPDRMPRFHGGHVLGVDSLHILWDN
ncbi:MAG TPA: cytochrome P450 [Novosphingobium sp.]